MQIKKLLKAAGKYISDSGYRFLIHEWIGCYDHLSDEAYLKRKYRAFFRKELNLENPQTFNEKIQWLKLYDRKPEYTVMVDKYRVREYIAQKIGEEYLIPLLGVWEDPEEIDFDALPDQFVLKCNHNSGYGMCICKDKSKLNIKKVKRGLKKSLETDYYLTGREWPYKDVPRRIIAEKYMTDGSGTELMDYKVMCFSGKVKLIQVHRGRFTNHTQDYYDADWNKKDIYQMCAQTDIVMERPCFLDQMLTLSEQLSANIPQLRVDWYAINNKLYFGELTLYDASGFDSFEPSEWDDTMGSWINLPVQKQ